MTETALPNGTHSRAVPPVLVHAHLAQLLQPLQDIRDRDTAEYREFFARLVADLKLRGMQVPILAYREGDKLRIIDGLTRYFAALMALLNTAPVLVFEEKPDEASLLLGQLQANAMRLDMTDLEYADVYQKLMTLNGWNAARLWREVHVNPATGTKRLSISTKLCEQVKAWVSDSSLAARPAYAISRIADHAQQIDLAEKYRKGVLCAEGVEAEVNRVLTGKKPKDKPLTLKQDGIALTVKKPTPEGIRAFAEKVLSALKKLRPGDGVNDLQFHMRST